MKITTNYLEEVINTLYTKYPNRLPSKEINTFELGKLVGQQEVITYLIGELESTERKNNGTKVSNKR